MSDEKVIRTLRGMAWERAKGELQSILQTYWDGHSKDDKFKAMDAAVEKFISEVQDNGLAE